MTGNSFYFVYRELCLLIEEKSKKSKITSVLYTVNHFHHCMEDGSDNSSATCITKTKVDRKLTYLYLVHVNVKICFCLINDVFFLSSE